MHFLWQWVDKAKKKQDRWGSVLVGVGCGSTTVCMSDSVLFSYKMRRRSSSTKAGRALKIPVSVHVALKISVAWLYICSCTYDSKCTLRRATFDEMVRQKDHDIQVSFSLYSMSRSIHVIYIHVQVSCECEVYVYLTCVYTVLMYVCKTRH